MKIFNLFLLLNFTLAMYVEAQVQRFVRKGSNVVLQCPLKSMTNSVVWRGPPNLMTISINQLIGSQLENFDIISNYATGEYNLSIRNVSYKREGLYQCDTVSYGRNVEFEVTLKLAEPLTGINIISTTSSREIHGTEGTLLKLKCSVNSGVPVPYITLVSNMKTLASNVSDFVTYEFLPKGNDNLKCINCNANNSVYYIEEMYQLIIKTKPNMLVHFQPSSTVDEGTNVDIWCKNNSGDFSGHIIWYLDGATIYGQNEQHLILESVSKHDAGNYSCEANNDVGVSFASSCLQIRYLPLPVDEKKAFRMSARLGSASKLSLTISSFPKPSVAWMDIPGGKVSPWTVSKLNESLYNIQSTIVPEKETHIGIYNFKVRNVMGSLNLRVRLIGTNVKVHPQKIGCNTFTDIILRCTMISSNILDLENWWTHTYDQIKIRNISGTIHNLTSELKISYCDYRDEGNYTCNWKSSELIYSSTSSVTINGLPIKSSKTVVFDDQLTYLKLHFIATPIFKSVQWLFNDMPILSKYSTSTVEAFVNLTIHGKNITKQGYVTTLILPIILNFVIADYSCIIQNSFGSMETTFKDQNVIYKMPSHDKTNTSTGIVSICDGLKPCLLQTTEFEHLIIRTENIISDRQLIIIVTTTALTALLAITVIVVSKHLKKNRSHAVSNTNTNPVENNSLPDVEDVYLEVFATPHGSYEEIGDIPPEYQREDRTITHTDDVETNKSSSLETHSSQDSKNIYDEVISLVIDLHTYSDVDESL